MRFLLLVIYNILLAGLLPFIVARLYLKSLKNSAYRARIKERFALIQAQEKPTIWLHAVSLGEARAALGLIKELIAKNYTLVVTTTTPTGAEVIAGLKDSVTHYYMPYDLILLTEIFLKKIQPKIALIMETEIWPSLYYCLHKNKIPLLILNARLSMHSLRNLKLLSKAGLDINFAISKILAQSKLDLENYKKLGISCDKLLLSGNLKYDALVSAKALEFGKYLEREFGDRPVFVVGSTHHDEEMQILKLLPEILKRLPTFLLVLVPRHPERFNSVAALIQEQYKLVRRSELGKVKVTSDVTVVLGDSMGELLSYYYAGDVAFVGGSLVDVGGHNLLEPLMVNTPVITGSYLRNFSQMSDLLKTYHGIVCVSQAEEIIKILLELFNEPQKRQLLLASGKKVVEANQGALSTSIKVIESYLD